MRTSIFALFAAMLLIVTVTACSPQSTAPTPADTAGGENVPATQQETQTVVDNTVVDSNDTVTLGSIV